MTETLDCALCGDEGHLVCRPAIPPATGDRYTVDCENGLFCPNSTREEHATPEAAIAAWNREQADILRDA